MSNRVLVVAAHPDDEVIGCGGALLGHARCNDAIHIVTLTDGEGARGESTGSNRRHKALGQVCEKLKATYTANDLHDNQLDQYPLLEIIKVIEKEVARFNPNIIYTHSRSELNVDHEICHRCVLTAARPYPNSAVAKILCFEVNSSTEWAGMSNNLPFSPNYYIDISDDIDGKQALLKNYQMEMRDHPHIRSIDNIIARNQVRGGEVGVAFAEAFVVERIVDKRL